jgi:hypothetical protein
MAILRLLNIAGFQTSGCFDYPVADQPIHRLKQNEIRFQTSAYTLGNDCLDLFYTLCRKMTVPGRVLVWVGGSSGRGWLAAAGGKIR